MSNKGGDDEVENGKGVQTKKKEKKRYPEGIDRAVLCPKIWYMYRKYLCLEMETRQSTFAQIVSATPVTSIL